MISTDFEQDLLTYLYRTPKRMGYFCDKIEPEHFTNRLLGDIYSLFRDLYLEYRQEIGSTALIHACGKHFGREEIEQVAEYLEYITGDNVVLGPWVDETTKQWLQERMTEEYHRKNQKALLEGDVDAVHENYRELVRQQALTVDRTDLDFVDMIEDLAIAVGKQHMNMIDTGITSLNTILGGGLAKNEFGIFFGPPNIGKSMLLAQIGYQAVISGKRVLHVTSEMTTENVGQRYVARLSEIEKNELWTEQNLPKVREKMAHWQANYRGSLKMEYLPSGSTANDVYLLLQEAIEEGRPYDLVFIDYIDTFMLRGQSKDMADWLMLEKVFQQFADLAKRPEDTAMGCGACILAITHATSKFDDKRKASHDALVRAKTSKGKVVDFSIYMGRNEKDIADDRIVLTCVKLRDRHATKRTTAVIANYGKARFDDDKAFTGIEDD